MTDNNNTAEFNREGENPFDFEEEKDNSTDSPSDETTTEENPSPDGDENNQDDPDKDKPFHEHPRWKQREDEWQKRFNDSEARHQEDLRKIREEFANARKDNAQQTQIPSWFGGTQEQWDAYRADRDAELHASEDRLLERIKGEKSAEDKAVTEANEYFKSEIAAIESDKTLNPTGSKVDPNKLLKIVLDNELIDSKGRWNYKAGWKILQSQSRGSQTTTTEQKSNQDRKKIAAATTTESKTAETKPAPFKTSKDFRQNRPW